MDEKLTPLDNAGLLSFIDEQIALFEGDVNISSDFVVQELVKLEYIGKHDDGRYRAVHECNQDYSLMKKSEGTINAANVECDNPSTYGWIALCKVKVKTTEL